MHYTQGSPIVAIGLKGGHSYVLHSYIEQSLAPQDYVVATHGLFTFTLIMHSV